MAKATAYILTANTATGGKVRELYLDRTRAGEKYKAASQNKKLSRVKLDPLYRKIKATNTA